MAILLVKVTVVSKEATDHFNLTPPYGQVEGCVSILKTDSYSDIMRLVWINQSNQSVELCHQRKLLPSETTLIDVNLVTRF